MQQASGTTTGAADVHATLKEIFGYDTFRPNQEEIVRAILEGRHIFAVMPTGGGKSLCYQLPARVMRGTTVVISPLISLMKDQVDGAVSMGLDAAFINSSMAFDEVMEVREKLLDGQLDLLYVSPERFAMEGFISTLERAPVTHFAIDEAHCISEWGHDFRPDYLALSGIVKNFPGVPVSAFTATATRKVQDDILKKLALVTPHTVRASFDRPNLFYRVIPKDNIKKQLLSFIQNHPGESGIIYRTSRKSVEETAAFLRSHNINALPYHAGMQPSERAKSQERFIRDDAQVVVATIAFGMGIDKSNISYILHGDLPKNIEGYYQETGRAGRDGSPAECVLYFSYGDISKMRYFIDQVEDEKDRQVASTKLQQMVNLGATHACRRRTLLAYFGEEYPIENCDSCDVCEGSTDITDATTDARIVMSAIARTGQRFGVQHIIDIVTGSDTEKIRERDHQNLKTYGAGAHQKKKYWRRVTNELLAQNCLNRTDDQYPVLQITNMGKEVLTGNTPFFITAIKERKRKREVDTSVYDIDLFEKLRTLRKKIADSEGVPAYIVFSDSTLREMCVRKPENDGQFLEVPGVGRRKLDKYGAEFMEVIRGG
ncbi:MAG: DNA helicase RecQ [Spirochaetota bacterium]